MHLFSGCFLAVLFFLRAFGGVPSLGQDPETQREIGRAEAGFSVVERENAYVSSLTPESLTKLPVGLKEMHENVEYALLVTKVSFARDHSVLDVYARVSIPEGASQGGRRQLYFGLQGLKLSHEGKVIGSSRLTLLGDVHIAFNDNRWLLVLKGGKINRSTGETSVGSTYASVSCSGVEELSIAGGIYISREFLVPLDAQGEIRPALAGGKPEDNMVGGSFGASVRSWNDILINTSLTPFAITAQTGKESSGYFSFMAKTVILDLSDLRNDPATVFPPGYGSGGYLVAGEKSWRGLYIRDLEIGLPREFANAENSGKRTFFEARNLLIDRYGVSGFFSARNVLPSGITGGESGWKYSLDKILGEFEASRLKGVSLSGTLTLPSDTTRKFSFTGTVSDSGYGISVGLGQKLNFSLLGAKADLNENSHIEFALREGKFMPRAVLHGSLNITGAEPSAAGSAQGETKSGLGFKVRFEELVLQTDSPFLSVGSLGAENGSTLANFPVSMDELSLATQDSTVALTTKITVSLQDNKSFSATGKVIIRGTMASDKGVRGWKYKDFSVSELGLKNVDIGIAKVSGSFALLHQDPVFGEGFKAALRASEIGGMDGLTVSVAAVFGKKETFRYWGFEGSVTNLSVPASGNIYLSGFTGAAFYKMLPKAYAPQGPKRLSEIVEKKTKREDSKNRDADFALGLVPKEEAGFGLRAGVYGFFQSKNVAPFMASFSIYTNAGGGLSKVGLDGEVFFMSEIENTFGNPLEKAQGVFAKAVENNILAGDIKTHERLEKTLDVLEVKKRYPISDTKSEKNGLYAVMAMHYDFNNRIFHANLDTYVNAGKGTVRGTGEHGRVGRGVIHVAPGEWYVHIGTPAERMGLFIGIGSLSISSGSYFMTGTNIPASPPPPPQVASILGINAQTLDYMKDLNALGTGSGVAFGADFSFDTGDMTALILYARFTAGIGGDMMLKNYGQTACSNLGGSQIGLSGWYANGQVYAYLTGQLGIKVKLFFMEKKIPIISAAAAALIQAKGPNPFWMRGYLGGSYDLLGGLVSGNFNFKLEFGEKCVMENAGAMGGLKVITDTYPRKQESDVDVFASPQATFAFKVEEPVTIEEDTGKHTYKIVVERFSVLDEGKPIAGKIRKTAANVMTFEPSEVLPPKKTLKLQVSVSFMEAKNGVFQPVTDKGQKITENVEYDFSSGTAPDNIPLKNVVYTYPVVDQKYLYGGESDKGYILLKKGQEYLFTVPGWKTHTVFTDESGTETTVDFTYDASAHMLRFDLPALAPGKPYTLRVYAKNTRVNTETPETLTESRTGGEEGNEANRINVTIKTTAAKAVSKDGSIERISYAFATSKYATLSEKIGRMTFRSGNNYVKTAVYTLFNEMASDEGFDLTELTGTVFSGDKPLIEARATLTDSHYRSLPYYSPYPMEDIRLNREGKGIGIPPENALSVGEYEILLKNQSRDPLLTNRFPYRYDLFSYYYDDWTELSSKASEKTIVSGYTGSSRVRTVAGFAYPAVPYQDYTVRLRYILPDGKPGSESTVIYKYQ